MQGSQVKIPLEVREELETISESAREALDVLMGRALSVMVSKLMLTEMTPSSEKEFLYGKARAEGAERLRREVNRFFKILSKIDE